MDRTGPIHKTRVVYNSNVTSEQTDMQISCSRPTWTVWLARANALHTTRDSRSYAQVLKQGKAVVQPNQVRANVQPIEKQQLTEFFCNTKARKTQKISHKSKKVSHHTHSPQGMSQKQFLSTYNRFQPLQSDLHNDQLENNMSLNNAALTVAMHWDYLDKHFVGNKNKTGKSLGQSHTRVKQQDGCQNTAFTTLPECPVQIPLHLEGSTHGNYSKLGQFHKTKAITQELMSDKQSHDYQVTSQSVDKNKSAKLLQQSPTRVKQLDCSENAGSHTLPKCPVQHTFNFKGNKNGNGSKLGHLHTTTEDITYDLTSDSHKSEHQITANSVENINKTIISVNQSTSHEKHNSPHNVSSTTPNKCPVQLPFHFKGNKNGIGSKLGHMDKTIEDTPHNFMSDNHISDYQLTVNPASIHFLGNKNGNGTKLGSQADLHITGETYIPRLMQTDPTYFSDPTVIEAQQLPCKRARQIPSQVYQSRFQSIDHKNCLYQNDKNFGFIPFNDLMVYTGPDIIWGAVPDIIEAHAKVRQSGLPNFMNVRIPLKTQLKVHCWKKYLHKYWDQQLVDLIQFGFPLDFDRQIVLQSTEVNHSSALKYPDHVSNYIQEELQYGAVLGPFKQFPFHCHVSPFLTREKPNSTNRRVILDLSFPPGNSVNAGVSKDKYLGSYFELKYPLVDHIVESLKQLGPTALLYKIDISRAFRHIRIDPGDLDLLGLRHDDYFIDGTLPFSFRHG